MKITLRTLVYSVLFTCFCSVANAQIFVPDSVRIGIGAELASTSGSGFGTGVNTQSGGTAAAAYSYGLGVSLRVDVPIIPAWYLTASGGYTSFFANKNASTSQQAISGIALPNFNTIPLKLGIKALIGNRFYIQGEAGETILLNKADLYAMYSYSFTWSPQIGFVFPLQKRHTYIDAGLRFETVAPFYYNAKRNNFWALHFAYAFNL